jgi:ATP-dependent Lhr-like helicase
LARRLYLLRTRAAEALREGADALTKLLRQDYGLDSEAVRLLTLHFQQQECVSEIPDAATLLIEGVENDRGLELFIHTPLNRPGNDALARVLVSRFVREQAHSTTSVVADLGFVLRVRGTITDPAPLVRRLLREEGFRTELDQALAQSEALRTRFSRVAQTAFMVLRQPEGSRRKVGGSSWTHRRLYESVRQREPEFVLLRQSLSELRLDLCDLEQALEYVGQLPALTIRCRWLSQPSPFSSAWTQTTEGPADNPLTPEEALLRLHTELTGGNPDAPAG